MNNLFPFSCVGAKTITRAYITIAYACALNAILLAIYVAVVVKTLRILDVIGG